MVRVSWVSGCGRSLKLRDIDQNFYKVEIGNGRNTSFWYDCWSELSVVSKLLGDRDVIDMGIRKSATVEEALLTDGRRRRQRTQMLNKVEEVLSSLRLTHDPEKGDTSLWRSNAGYKTQFSPQETWCLIREVKEECNWVQGVWFSKATPKFAFITWLVMLDRL